MLVLPRVLIGDPLGLAAREVSARPSPGDDEILVLPRIEPVVAAPGGGDAARIARRGRPAVGAEVELDGIRPLRDGTPASRIFWPAVARGAEPQERFLTAASESRPVVVLDPRGAASEAALDAAVRATASLARAFASEGGCQVLLPGDRRPVDLGETLAGWPHLHARLALIGSSGGPSLASVAQRRGPVVFERAYARAGAGRARPGPRRDADRRRARAVALAPRDVRRRRLPRLRGQRAADPRGPRAAPGAAQVGMSIAPPRPPAPPPPRPGSVRSAPPTPPPAPPQAPPLLPVHVARLVGFVPLAGLGALQWSRMVEPDTPDALLGCVLMAATAGYGLSAVARRRSPVLTDRGHAAGRRAAGARRARRCGCAGPALQAAWLG